MYRLKQPFCKRFVHLVLAAGMAAVLSGCATSSQVYTFQSSQVFESPFERVWSFVEKMFEERNWPVERIEKDAGAIVSGWVKDEMDGGDYGYGGFMVGGREGDRMGVNSVIVHSDTKQMAINVQIIRQSGGATRVRVHCLFRIQKSKFSEKDRRWHFGTSKGVVEEEVLNTLRRGL